MVDVIQTVCFRATPNASKGHGLLSKQKDQNDGMWAMTTSTTLRCKLQYRRNESKKLSYSNLFLPRSGLISFSRNFDAAQTFISDSANFAKTATRIGTGANMHRHAFDSYKRWRG